VCITAYVHEPTTCPRGVRRLRDFSRVELFRLFVLAGGRAGGGNEKHPWCRAWPSTEGVGWVGVASRVRGRAVMSCVDGGAGGVSSIARSLTQPQATKLVTTYVSYGVQSETLLKKNF
jgi:hypothetical protein